MNPCTCRDPICPKAHSHSGLITSRMDYLAHFYSLGALFRWEADLQEKTDPESTEVLRFVKRAIHAHEEALYGRSEPAVMADYRELRSQMAKAAE